MPNPYFKFKQFTIFHDRCAMKVTTDACLFGGWVAKELENEKPGLRLLDIGTGTGLLSLMIAQKNKLVTDAVEIDQEASEQARSNVEASPWHENIRVINEDILLVEPSIKYDVIISNPPFYENELESSVEEKNKAHHGSGLKLVELMNVIDRFLNEDGLFFLLLPYKRITEVDKLLRPFHVIKDIEVAPSTLHSPTRIMIKASRRTYEQKQEIRFNIWDDKKNYTPEFIRLLQDYYLYL